MAATLAPEQPTLASVSTLNGQELEIFRAGPHGIPGKRVFSAAEVDQIAASYGADGHEAPIVIGHPQLDSPAFGWIKSLRSANGILYAVPHQVVPEFDSAVQQNFYKKRSAAFDPLPGGKWGLRHVGYLGGTPPVVKGLADARFASDQYEEFEYSTEGEPMEQVDKRTVTQWIREAFADVFGGNKAATQTAEIEAIEQRLEAKFADQLKVEREARIASETKFANFQTEQAKAGQSAAATAAVDKLKAEGKWLKAFDSMHVPALFAAIAEGDTQEFEFADGEGKTQKMATLEALGKLVGSIAKFVPKGQVFGDEQRAAAATPVVKPNVPEGVAVDAGSQGFDAEIRARMDKDKIDYPTAARRLTNEGKSSATYAAASAGAV